MKFHWTPRRYFVPRVLAEGSHWDILNEPQAMQNLAIELCEMSAGCASRTGISQLLQSESCVEKQKYVVVHMWMASGETHPFVVPTLQLV